MNFYIFAFLLLFIFFFLIKGLQYSLKAPFKIKLLSTIVLTILFLRYVSVAILFFSQNIRYLYLFKPVYLSYLVCVPIIFLIVIYIFGRTEKINFTVVWWVSFVLFLCYGLIIVLLPATLQNMGSNGYCITLDKAEYVNWAYIGIITIALLYSLVAITKTKVIKLGISFIIIACLITIGDFLFKSIGISFIAHQQLLGETWFIGCMCYSLFKVKK